MLKYKSEFTKNILILISGTAVSQAIPIAISPVLTRIYTPDDFGVFSIFIAIVITLRSVINGGYELAIVLPKKDEDAINLLALGFIINCLISLALLVFIALFNNDFATLLGNEEMAFWLYFLPISVFFIGLFNVLNYFNNRIKKYKDLRKAIILKSIILAVVQLSFGFIKSGACGLISGDIISNMFANVRLLKNIFKDRNLIFKISKVKIIALSRRYKDFPKYNLISSLCDVLALQLASIIIPRIFSLTIGGYFF